MKGRYLWCATAAFGSLILPWAAYQSGPHFESGRVVQLTNADLLFYPSVGFSMAVMVTALIAAISPEISFFVKPKSLLLTFLIALSTAELIFFVPILAASELGKSHLWVVCWRTGAMAFLLLVIQIRICLRSKIRITPINE